LTDFLKTRPPLKKVCECSFRIFEIVISVNISDMDSYLDIERLRSLVHVFKNEKEALKRLSTKSDDFVNALK